MHRTSHSLARRGATLLLALLLLAPSAGWCLDPLDDGEDGEEGATTHRARVRGRVESFTWREYDGGSRLLEETGPRYVLGGEVAFRRGDLTVTPRVDLLYGMVDYDGQTQNGTPATTDVEYRGFSLSLDAGKGTVFPSGASLEPHASLGWDSWRRDIRSNGTAIGYVEHWDSFVVRGGVRGEYPLRQGGGAAALFADAGVEWPVATTNSVNFPGVGRETVVHPKGQPWPYAEAGISVGAVRLSATYRGYRFDASDAVPIGGTWALSQPESMADVYGGELSYGF